MCRAHPDRMRPQQLSGKPGGGIASRIRSRAKNTTADVSAVGSVGVGAEDEGVRGEWSSAAARVVELKEEGLFRKIVGYL